MPEAVAAVRGHAGRARCRAPARGRLGRRPGASARSCCSRRGRRTSACCSGRREAVSCGSRSTTARWPRCRRGRRARPHLPCTSRAASMARGRRRRARLPAQVCGGDEPQIEALTGVDGASWLAVPHEPERDHAQRRARGHGLVAGRRPDDAPARLGHDRPRGRSATRRSRPTRSSPRRTPSGCKEQTSTPQPRPDDYGVRAGRTDPAGPQQRRVGRVRRPDDHRGSTRSLRRSARSSPCTAGGRCRLAVQPGRPGRSTSRTRCRTVARATSRRRRASV